MNLLGKIIAGIVGIALSVYFVKAEVFYDGQIETILLVGAILGLLLFFVKPILSFITFPLRVITLNIFSLVIVGLLVWLLDAIFPEEKFQIINFYGFIKTTLIVWISELLLASDL
ncbi:MAG: phage holin family protein [Candidatus Paceibacterota bacterium]|jgi:putative membrane protein|nr:phage holin family protein [bacterium]